MSTTATTIETLSRPAVTDNLLPQPETSQLDAKVPKKSAHFDPATLKRKYDEEREKRLQHGGGLDQYRTIDGEFSHLLQDPFRGPRLVREPIKEECDVVVIGGGYGAQLVSVELMKAGIKDIRIVEKGGDFGGTWYWNRYPGAQCDIESYVYMPLLDETSYVPTWKYTGGRELLAYAQSIGTRYGLYEKAYFQTEVKTLRWQESSARWNVETDRGDVISSRFVVPAAGPLHRPKLPGLPGLGTFKGHSFHTSRWDYNYTGGDPHTASEDLTGLANKRVGVIGTGATAVQIVPHLGRWAKQLYVFQRTPSSIDVRGNKPTDADWVNTLGEHWQKKRKDNFNIIVNGGMQEEDLVSDGWTDILRKLTVNGPAGSAKGDPATQAKNRQMLDFEKMEQIRSRVDAVVNDPDTAASLKPYYNYFCKRPCFHDEYLPTFNRPNVKLIDTHGKGVEAMTEKGIVANGEEIELDCLVFATGFELATSWTQKAGIEIFGKDGQALSGKWAEGPRTFHGYSTRGFPNCFFISHIQAGLSPNFLHITGFQAQHFSFIIRSCQEQSARTVEPTQEAEDAWVQEIIDGGDKRRSFRLQCTPGYYNNEGQTSADLEKKGSYAGGALEFMRALNEWRENGKMEGLEIR